MTTHRFCLSVIIQKQPSKDAFRKRCSENIRWIYRRIRMPKCDFTLWHGSQFDPWCSRKCLSVKLPVANKCSSSWYGLMVITWKYNTMIKSRLWSQSWLRQTCNVFLFTFIKHLFKRRDVLHIGCLVKKKKKNDVPHSFDTNN